MSNKDLALVMRNLWSAIAEIKAIRPTEMIGTSAEIRSAKLVLEEVEFQIRHREEVNK